MRFARAATMAVAAVLMVQVAFADSYVKPSINYCFHAKIDKPHAAATCPAGHTLEATLHKCFKNIGYSCKVGNLSTDSYGAAVCKICKPWQKLGVDGKCIKDCNKGYVSTLINGRKQCVQSCEAGFYAQGTDCISSKKHYEPKRCSTKLCLPGFQLYFTASTNVTKPAGRKLANAAPAPAKLPSCICALTLHRKVYQQEHEAAKAIMAVKEVKVASPMCPTGDKPLLGKCTLPCPNTCKEILGKCEYGCPAGYTECKTWLFSKICVKGSGYAAGTDVCKEAKKVVKLDKEKVCPVPVVVKPKPSPAPKPKASPAPK